MMVGAPVFAENGAVGTPVSAGSSHGASELALATAPVEEGESGTEDVNARGVIE